MKQARQFQNMKLSIEPLYASDCSGMANCNENSIAENDKITIKNKRRDKFQLLVGGGLTITNVIFDSLDSIVGKNFILRPIDDLTDLCLNRAEDCCVLTDGAVT